MFILNNNLKEINNILSNNNFVMCYGGDGCGKSSIAKELLKCNKNCILIDLKSASIDFMSIAIALRKPIATPIQNLNYFIEFLASNDNKTIVFDHILACSASSFSVLINLIKSSEYYNNTKVVGFYNNSCLYKNSEREHYEKIFYDFIKYRIQISKENYTEVGLFIEQKTNKSLGIDILQQLFTDMQDNIRAVTQVIELSKTDNENILYSDFDVARVQLLSENIKNRLNALGENYRNVVQQTAAVGLEFDTEFMEACFNIAQIDAILLGIMQYDNRLYKEIKTNTYSFFNQETRDCIYGSLSSSQKNILNMKIGDFCAEKANSYAKIFERINYINLAYLHYKETYDKQKTFATGCQLLKLYEYIEDYSRVIELCKELPKFSNKDESYFIMSYLMYVLIDENRYAEANKIIDDLHSWDSSLKSAISYRYFELSYIRNLYLSSAEPLAYKRALDLKNKIVNIRDNVFLTQFNSILTSIFDNRGDYSQSIKCEKQAYLYAKKCHSQFYIHQLYLKSQIHASHDKIKVNLLKAAKYFQETQNFELQAQANHNYGSELMFTCNFINARQPINSSYEYYKSKGSVWSAYPLNNLAVLDIIEHKYDAAIKKLLMPLPCGSELFTGVTMLCNRLVCYIKMNNLIAADESLSEIKEKMESAKLESESFYLQVYINLMEALLLYHKNKFDDAKKLMINIKIPDNYPFINEFINGMLADMREEKAEYSFPYIREFVKEKIYLCDFLFIE